MVGPGFDVRAGQPFPRRPLVSSRGCGPDRATVFQCSITARPNCRANHRAAVVRIITSSLAWKTVLLKWQNIGLVSSGWFILPWNVALNGFFCSLKFSHHTGVNSRYHIDTIRSKEIGTCYSGCHSLLAQPLNYQCRNEGTDFGLYGKAKLDVSEKLFSNNISSYAYFEQ